MNRLAVVTGTSSGIGLAAATRLLGRGWEVLGVARRPAPIENDRYRHLELDLAQVGSASQRLERELGPELGNGKWDRVGLVNNAAAATLGALEGVEPEALLHDYALNTVMPIWLMGFALRTVPPSTPLRVVNVSSGAATHAFPGLGVYCGAKAALRMSGQVLAAELDSPLREGGVRARTDILSYEPGIVDTPMQTGARNSDYPWVGMFKQFYADGLLVSAEASAGPIVDFLEGEPAQRFTESRFGT
jgi:NAD(P)-dependent dehydrogenase (short-subunit alcohol dehydrogenase family)